MKRYLMGIDIGTSACKVAIFDYNGNVTATESGAYKIYHPQHGWAEQNPNEWWSVLCETCKRLFAENQISPNEIAGIGIDGQSWSAIPIDKSGNVLHNTPIWFDTRAAEFCDEMKNTVGEETIFNLCGNPIQPTYTLPKILWFKKHHSDIYNNTYKFLQSNSYIVYKLTDAITQDISQGYGYHCFNMRTGEWDESMCDKLGIEIDMLPDIFQCHQVVGAVTATASQLTGIAIGTPVIAGGLDAACGTLGTGVIHNGETQEQGGQAGGMSCCIDSYHADKRLILSHHVVPNHWLLQGGTVGGGGVYKWFETNFGESERRLADINNTNSFYELDKQAETINVGSDGVVFLPYMAGERSPIWDAHAKGVFYGLDYTKTKAHMARACMEGVAFSLLHNIEIAETCGVKITELHAMGGAANSRLWTQIKSDVTNKKINVPSADTATTLGAAILAGVGVGVYTDFDEAVNRTIKITRSHIPDIENNKTYQKNYKIYLELYNSLKHIMRTE